MFCVFIGAMSCRIKWGLIDCMFVAEIVCLSQNLQRMIGVHGKATLIDKATNRTLGVIIK